MPPSRIRRPDRLRLEDAGDGRSMAVVGFAAVAVGFGIWLAFASDQIDAESAREAVSAGIRTGVTAEALLFVGAFVALLLRGIHLGREEGRLALRIVGASGLGLAAMLLGFVLMLIVVHAAFA